MKTKVLIIGMGYMGKKHFEAYLRNNSTNVVGLVCKNKFDCKEISKDYKIFTDVNEAIKKTKPDVASICVPTNMHFEIAKKCVECGLDVLIEKPITSTLEQAEKLKKLAKEEGRLILCAHTELFNPVIKKFLELIIKRQSKEKIKKIIIKKYGNDVSPKYRLKIFKSSKKQLYDGLIHLMYILNCIIPSKPAQIKTNYLDVGDNKEKIDSILNINNTAVNLISEYDKSFNLHKTIHIEFENGSIGYVLEKGKEKIFFNNQEVKMFKSKKNTFDNMISFFIESRNKKDHMEHKASIDNAIQTMFISQELIANKNISKIKNQREKILTIRPNLKCNLNCKFCNIKFENGFKEKSFDKICKEMINKLPDEITITGGEPTIYPNFFKILDFAKRIGVRRISLQTNAVMCSYKEFSKKLREYGLTEALVSFHSHEKEISEYLSNTPGSWSKSIQGIKNLLSCGIRIRLAHVINSKNYKSLPKFILFVKKEFPNLWGIDLLLDQHRGMGAHYKELLPKLSDIKPYLSKAMKTAKENNIELINAFTIPLCFWEDPHSSHEYLLLKRNDKNSFDQVKSLIRDKIKSNSCKKCIYDKYCMGVWNTYGKIYGLNELEPILKKGF